MSEEPLTPREIRKLVLLDSPQCTGCSAALYENYSRSVDMASEELSVWNGKLPLSFVFSAESRLCCPACGMQGAVVNADGQESPAKVGRMGTVEEAEHDLREWWSNDCDMSNKHHAFLAKQAREIIRGDA